MIFSPAEVPPAIDHTAMHNVVELESCSGSSSSCSSYMRSVSVMARSQISDVPVLVSELTVGQVTLRS